jgi:hypothetical protein
MSVEQFEKMFDKYYERGTDRLRLRGDSHQPRQFISQELGYAAQKSDPAAMATAHRCKGSWPYPNMLDEKQTMFLMDGEYAPGNTFQGCQGYFTAAESSTKTFVFHTSTIYTNVQVYMYTHCACSSHVHSARCMYMHVCMYSVCMYMHVYVHVYILSSQVLHHRDEHGHVTKFDGMKHGIINMGNGILFIHEFLRQYLGQSGRNNITLKGFWDGRVQEWRDNFSVTDGKYMHVNVCS